jgi:hypothetical protein
MTKTDYQSIRIALEDPDSTRCYLAKERLDVIRSECNAQDTVITYYLNYMAKAIVAWREGYPERSFIQPDFGVLLDWLMEKAGVE